MIEHKKITEGATHGVEAGGAMSDHLTLAGAGAAAVVAPILYVVDKKMSKEKKEQIASDSAEFLKKI